MKREPPSFLRLSIHPWGLLTAAGGVACSATLLGFLGRLHWLLDLFSHFRVQYLLALLVLGVLLLAARRRGTSAAFFAFACLNLGLVLPLYLGGRSAAPEGAHALRAMLLNVNTELGDAGRVKRAIQEANPDILVLEEISPRWVRDLAWLTNSHPYSVVEPREDNFGIGLFSRLPLAEGRIVHIGDAGVPSVIARASTSGGPLAIVATHPLPPGGARYSRLRDDQLERLPGYVPAALPAILLGDLNVTPWNDHFRRLLRRTGLRDSSQGRGVQPTWPNFNPLLLIPIDHCLHSPGVAVCRKEIGPDVGSDHYPVIVDFAIERGGQGGGPARRERRE